MASSVQQGVKLNSLNSLHFADAKTRSKFFNLSFFNVISDQWFSGLCSKVRRPQCACLRIHNIDDYNLMQSHRRPFRVSSKLAFAKVDEILTLFIMKLLLRGFFLKKISIRQTAITPNTNWFWCDNEAAGAGTQAFVCAYVSAWLFIYLSVQLFIYFLDCITRARLLQISVRVHEGWNKK